jgi:hypothetical protein
VFEESSVLVLAWEEALETFSILPARIVIVIVVIVVVVERYSYYFCFYLPIVVDYSRRKSIPPNVARRWIRRVYPQWVPCVSIWAYWTAMWVQLVELELVVCVVFLLSLSQQWEIRLASQGWMEIACCCCCCF